MTSASSEFDQARDAVQRNREQVRAGLLARLNELDGFAFEQFIGHWLARLGYQDVRVTDRGPDGGLDILAKAELPLLSVQVAVQVKRWKASTVKREVVDALRGSLYRVGASHGILVTTSSFSDGAQVAAAEDIAPPITLIDGERLLDLLFSSGFAVIHEAADLWAIDEAMFSRLGSAGDRQSSPGAGEESAVDKTVRF